MSYTNSVKEELCATLSKKNCCRRACLAGMLAARATCDGETVTLAVDGERLSDLATHLIREQFGREAERVRRRGTVASSALVFTSPAAARQLALFDTGDPEAAVPEKCENCRRAFLSGAFLACGRLGDPAKDYRLEFSCGMRRDLIAAVLAAAGWHGKPLDRRAEKLLYFRDSTAIEDILTTIGATQATFAVMASKIERDMRNEVNRLTNCDANNINKATAVSAVQIAVIERLIEENKISFLPPELVETARLRVENADLSLGQLAAIAQPPMTKSGLNHRLSRIMELGAQLLKQAGQNK